MTTRKYKPNPETELLIESMQKLIDHMNENSKHQEEIFQSLTSNDVLKILQNFEDPNPIMRKTSAAFLCELVYDNEPVQKGFCQITNILSTPGKICVNKLPQSCLTNPKQIPGLTVIFYSFLEILEAIKQSSLQYDETLCWYYDPPKDRNWKKGVKFIKFERNVKNAKSRVQNFIDPQLNLFGFIIKGDKKQKIESQKLEMEQQDIVDNQFSTNEQPQQLSPKQKVKTIGSSSGSTQQQFAKSSHEWYKGKQTTEPTQRSAVGKSQEEKKTVKTKKAGGYLTSGNHSNSPNLYGVKNKGHLNNSVDLGMMQNGMKQQQQQQQNVGNKTVVEYDQFVIEEEQRNNTKKSTATKVVSARTQIQERKVKTRQQK